MPVDLIRFDGFELDARNYCLRRSGKNLKLERIPLELLLLLASRAGELVTREEIIEKLWGKAVYLDTENAINTAIRKIRQALGDDPAQPRFVQTVTGRGYRFVANVAAPSVPPTHIGPSSRMPRRKWLSWGWLAALVAMLSVAVALLYVRHTRGRLASTPAHTRIMLAVLPFTNLSDDPQQEYFSDGLTEETITDLGELSPERVGVIARTSAMSYKHTMKTVSQIGQDLGVDYVLEGSVRREGQRARISAQLIRVKDQTQIWGRSYDRNLQDLLGVQTELGRAISQQLQISLTLERREYGSTRRRNPEAYDKYLRARYFFNTFTPDGLKKSIGLFQEAIAADPAYSQAFAGLAESYGVLMDYNVLPPADTYLKAETAARKAVELDNNSSDAHTALGWQMLGYDRDFQGAEREFRRAIELNRSNADAHAGLANYFAVRGQFDEALSEITIARELDPLSLIVNVDVANVLFFARRYDEAIQQLRSTLDLYPDSHVPHYVLSLIYQAEGRYEEAYQETFKELTAGGSDPLFMAEIEAIHRKSGWKAAYQKLLATRRVSTWDLAGLSLVVGEKQQTVDLLQRASDERLSRVIFLNVDPRYDSLRSDPRFRDLLRHLGLWS